MSYTYDILVIGSGPGGEGAAMKCVKSGKRVAVVENFEDVGGNCTHKGTIPSKALRQYIQQHIDIHDFTDAEFPELLSRAGSVVA